MNLLKYVLVAVAFLLSLNFSLAQRKGSQKQPSTQNFEGIVVQKPWTKSSESYCAQGSEYFVLESVDKKVTFVLKNNPNIDYASYTNKVVVITGRLETRIIPANNNPLEQRPSTGTENTFKCTALEVDAIKKKR
jgi:hypothetical protein